MVRLGAPEAGERGEVAGIVTCAGAVQEERRVLFEILPAMHPSQLDSFDFDIAAETILVIEATHI